MATERELIGQSRQYVLLPVIRIIFRSLILPFKHIHEVWKVGLITFGVMLAANLMELFVNTHIEVGSNLTFQASGPLVHASSSRRLRWHGQKSRLTGPPLSRVFLRFLLGEPKYGTPLRMSRSGYSSYFRSCRSWVWLQRPVKGVTRQ
jgi:hypothetical protein